MLITLRKCIRHFFITLLKININKFEQMFLSKNVLLYLCTIIIVHGF